MAQVAEPWHLASTPSTPSIASRPPSISRHVPAIIIIETINYLNRYRRRLVRHADCGDRCLLGQDSPSQSINTATRARHAWEVPASECVGKPSHHPLMLRQGQTAHPSEVPSTSQIISSPPRSNGPLCLSEVIDVSGMTMLLHLSTEHMEMLAPSDHRGLISRIVRVSI